MGYLKIKLGIDTKSYELYASPDRPRIRVSNSYLPLMTQSQYYTGLKVNINGTKYVPYRYANYTSAYSGSVTLSANDNRKLITSRSSYSYTGASQYSYDMSYTGINFADAYKTAFNNGRSHYQATQWATISVAETISFFTKSNATATATVNYEDYVSAGYGVPALSAFGDNYIAKTSTYSESYTIVRSAKSNVTYSHSLSLHSVFTSYAKTLYFADTASSMLTHRITGAVSEMTAGGTLIDYRAAYNKNLIKSKSLAKSIMTASGTNTTAYNAAMTLYRTSVYDADIEDVWWDQTYTNTYYSAKAFVSRKACPSNSLSSTNYCNLFSYAKISNSYFQFYPNAVDGYAHNTCYNSYVLNISRTTAASCVSVFKRTSTYMASTSRMYNIKYLCGTSLSTQVTNWVRYVKYKTTDYIQSTSTTGTSYGYLSSNYTSLTIRYTYPRTAQSKSIY